MFLISLIIFVGGVVLFAVSSKQREESGEWGGGLQWAYLLMMVGIFGVLSQFMSFTAVLLIFVVVTGVIWLIHKISLKKNNAQDNNHFTDYMSGFFPIILVVFILRSFIAEPFQIPSSSMRPGLVVGDFILVNKFAYGIRLPIANTVLIPVGHVERGDVVVFNYPEKPAVNYIKRVIGVGGDVVEYKDKKLSINGKAVNDKLIPEEYNYPESTGVGEVNISAEQYRENLDGKMFSVLVMPHQPSVIAQGVRTNFPFRDQCQYADSGSGFRCTVPEGHYFMMGDNRDNSEDSRYWGFVDDKLIVGKAFLVWLNPLEMSRIGTHIQ